MADHRLHEAFESRFGDQVLFEEPLAKHVAWGVGGPAEFLVFPKDADDLQWIADTARAHQLPISIIGTGTNLLVLDEGIRGIVLSLTRAFRDIGIVKESDAETWVRVGAGVSKPELLSWAVERGLAGLEFSAGVPGTLGGGIYMNAGTKYGCYADILEELSVFDFERGLITKNRANLYFGYREQQAVGDALAVSMVFRLRAADSQALQAEVDRIIQERAEKQPLDYPSCGSTFKNPPGYSAGRLIERSGLKGLRSGDAEISLKHANFILNKGQAKAADILNLIETIKSTVQRQFSVSLECEVIVLGERSGRTLQAD